MSPTKIHLTAKLLRNARFPLPKEVFDAWAGSFPTVPLELAVLKNKKILLCKRGADDKFWPNKWHTPGTILRQNEHFTDAYERLVKNELGVDAKKLGKLRFLSYFEYLKGAGPGKNPRGHEIPHLFIVRPRGNILLRGTFFPLNKIPRNIVEHQKVLFKFLRSTRYS